MVENETSMGMQLFILILTLSGIPVMSGQWLVPCNASVEYTGPKLPTLPDQFTMHIEANIVQKNLTFNIREYYDYNGNRAAIEGYIRHMGEFVRTIMDFNQTVAKTVHSNGSCTTHATNSTRAGFGLFLTGNGSHIKTAKDLLYFSKDKGEVFVDGDKRVRGIPVNHWTTCVSMPSQNGTFTLDYYFTKENYSVDSQEQSIPVRVVLNGTGHSRSRNGSVSEDVHSFYHIYEIADFKWGPVKDESVFEIPVGTICLKPDMTASEKAPSIPKYFSAGVERVTVKADKETESMGAQMYVDSYMYRMDENLPVKQADQQQYGMSSLTNVYDSSWGIVYVIDRERHNCTYLEMDKPEVGINIQPLVTLNFFVSSSENFTFQGQKTWRGLKADAWGFYNQTTGEVLELLFRPRSVMSVKPAPDEAGPVIHYDPIGVYHHNPATTNSWQLEETTYVHIFNFMFGHPQQDVFDVSVCFSENHYTTFYVKVESASRSKDGEDTIQYHQREFVAAFKQVISKAAKVSVTRISTVTVTWENRDDTLSLTVSFKLLDSSTGDHAIFWSAPNLEIARNNLIDAVQRSNGLRFQVQTRISSRSDLITKDYMVKGGSLWEAAPSSTTPAPTGESSIRRYGAGSMAGLGIGMLILGALLGLVAAFIIYKRIDTSVPYETQMNTVS